jgi:hypothetical protein
MPMLSDTSDVVWEEVLLVSYDVRSSFPVRAENNHDKAQDIFFFGGGNVNTVSTLFAGSYDRLIDS